MSRHKATHVGEEARSGNRPPLDRHEPGLAQPEPHAAGAFESPQAGPVLPDLDVWVRAFGRLDPDPRTVHAFRELVRARRILVLGWVQQELLARVDDERQAARLAWIFSGFPEVVLRSEDRLGAASLTRALRRSGVALPNPAALLWAVARRIGAQVWSLDRRWRALAGRGAPLFNPTDDGGPLASPTAR